MTFWERQNYSNRELISGCQWLGWGERRRKTIKSSTGVYWNDGIGIVQVVTPLHIVLRLKELYMHTQTTSL